MSTPQYRKENAEKLSTKSKLWRTKNRDRYNAYHHDYYQAHREEIVRKLREKRASKKREGNYGE